MYRDGVSEGQFFNVLQAELRAMREACLMLERGYQPGITFIAVQKRHHTRLFAVERRDQVREKLHILMLQGRVIRSGGIGITSIGQGIGRE